MVKLKVGDRIAFYPPVGRRTGRIIGEGPYHWIVAADSPGIGQREVGLAHVSKDRKINRLKKKSAPPTQKTPRTGWSFDRHDGTPTDRLFTAPQAEFHARWLKSRGIGFKKTMWREVLEK